MKQTLKPNHFPVTRFWTQFEAWLALQAMTSQGLHGVLNTAGQKKRYSIVGILTAKKRINLLRDTIEDMWGTATAEVAHKNLSHENITVTSQKDKEIHLPKIKVLNEDVKRAFCSVMAERGVY